jgi:hypothetical protein
MEDREELQNRVDELEREVAAFRGRAARWVRNIRKRAAWGIGGLPFYEIALGPDVARGEQRGHARAVIAVGDMATGIVALGGFARGVFAVGGLAVGVLSFGGLSMGLLCAVGGLAIGSVAVGGGAIGGAAIGGGAAGYYACGGGAAGRYVVDAARRDAEALELFRRYGLGGVCPSPPSSGYPKTRP